MRIEFRFEDGIWQGLDSTRAYAAMTNQERLAQYLDGLPRLPDLTYHHNQLLHAKRIPTTLCNILDMADDVQIRVSFGFSEYWWYIYQGPWNGPDKVLCVESPNTAWMSSISRGGIRILKFDMPRRYK